MSSCTVPFFDCQHLFFSTIQNIISSKPSNHEALFFECVVEKEREGVKESLTSNYVSFTPSSFTFKDLYCLVREWEENE